MNPIKSFRNHRRQRIIKEVLAAGQAIPSVQRLGRPRLTHWLRGDYTIRNSELLFSAVSRIANAISSMPVQLYKGPAPVQDNLNEMIRLQPNPNMTSCRFFQTMEACRCTYGNAYAMKVYGPDGAVTRLDILDPAKVKPVMEEESRELWYRIQPTESGKEILVHNYNILHLPFLSTNGYSGVSPVSVLFDTLSYSESIQSFSREQAERGIYTAVIVEAPGNLDAGRQKRLIENMQTVYDESDGNILLLESGLTAKPMNLSPVDSKLFEVEKITRSKVAMVYNIPPHLLGDYSDTSFSSQEQQMLEFLTLTMLPIITAYEQELDLKLLSNEERVQGYHFRFNMDAILRADAATRAEVDYKAVRSGWSTVDEIRASRNLAPLPRGVGQEALVSQDLATLEYTVREKPRVLAGK